ncbi:MAG TPA: hypothetical protein VFI06_06080 [Chitinophagaceae bacterium]|nr:hypothetical protein [Chitinophagaceae bacterium]
MSENKPLRQKDLSVTGDAGNLIISPGLSAQKEIERELSPQADVHKKTKWREYLVQFILLLLAVFLGSIAATKREEWLNLRREKAYMGSMVRDLKKDTAEISSRYAFSFEQIQKIDSLQILFSHDLKNNLAEVSKCYELSLYLTWNSPVVFNERTFAQLTGSGNMRIIEKNGAADSIMDYYNSIKRIEQQKQQYIIHLNQALSAMYKVLDITYLRQQLNTTDSTLHWANLDWHDLHLRTTDRDKLTDLSSTLENTKLVINTYMQQLYAINLQATSLIRFLQENYGLEND